MKKTTDTGYINRNDQRNNGRTEERGTDHCQWYYEMECLKCNFKYKANNQMFSKESVLIARRQTLVSTTYFNFVTRTC